MQQFVVCRRIVSQQSVTRKRSYLEFQVPKVPISTTGG